MTNASNLLSCAQPAAASWTPLQKGFALHAQRVTRVGNAFARTCQCLVSKGGCLYSNILSPH